MCKATSELKLCTCDLGEKIPDSYWILYVYKAVEEGESLLLPDTMGEIMLIQQDSVKEETFAAFIRSSLNKHNCFDIHLNIQEEDVLEIGMKTEDERFHYYFKYENGNWDYYSLDPFQLMDLYDKVSEGITKPEIYKYFKKIL